MLPPDVPLISVSKGLEVGTGKMMSEIIPAALGRKHPAIFLSGPSFAREVMDLRPTAIVAASKVACLAFFAQALPEKASEGFIGACIMTQIVKGSHASETQGCHVNP